MSKNARTKPFPYEVRYCDLSFFKKYEIDSFKYESIQPGKMYGDPTVTNIKALRYKCDGTIDFKINF